METNENNYPNRRKPWVAIFLTMVMPGLGHVYCGCIVRGLVIMAAMAFVTSSWVFGMIIQGATPLINTIVVIWGMVMIVSVFIAIDAYRRARRTRYDYKRKDYNHWVIYIALIWIAGAGTIGYTAIVKKNICEAFVIPVDSMAPTIMAGDRALADKIIYTRNDPQHGDVVLFKNPKNRKINYIKRIVALGGDTLEVKNGKLIINEQPLKTEWIEKKTISINKKNVDGDIFWETNGNARYQIFIAEKKSERGNIASVTVPTYHCFVMGDNRNYSEDSRYFGTLSLGAIKGKFRSIYWPFQRRATLDAQK